MLLALGAHAAEPSAASLVATTSADDLTAGLHASAALTRATAARVAMLHNMPALLPLIRETLAQEHDAIAAREEIRALAILGTNDDVALAAKESAKWPPAMDDVLADAIARRGADAVDLYHSLLAGSRMSTRYGFFRLAMWSHPEQLPVTASHLLAWHDAAAWSGLLRAALDSHTAMPAGPMTASLAADDEIRSSSIWYLVRGYADDPSAIKDPLRAALLEPRKELASNREDFGRELLRRMLGGTRNDDDRWLKFLTTDEADKLLENESESVLQYLTDAEYRTRHARCAIQSSECRMPAKRSPSLIPSQPVAEPPFVLPSLLPPGLAAAVMSEQRCKDGWLGVATASVDAAGRVQAIDMKDVQTSSACGEVAKRLLLLSLATPASMRSPKAGPVLLARARQVGLCLDEPPPEVAEHLLRVGGDVKAPIVKKRVEPTFPESARLAMGGGKDVIIVIEAVISREGCIRNMRLLTQSPFGELNGAALIALSGWTFVPGYFEGKPVDVIFNMTVHFQVRR